MNKSDKVISLLLGLILAGWLWHEMSARQEQVRNAQAQVQAEKPAEGAAVKALPELAQSSTNTATEAIAAKKEVVSAPTRVHLPEKIVTLSNDVMVAAFSTRGATLKSATMLKYAEKAGAITAENPALRLDFAEHPALALSGIPGLEADADYTVSEMGSNFVVFTAGTITRRITLMGDYKVEVRETFADAAHLSATPSTLSLGVMALGSSKNDILSIDSMPLPNAKGKAEVEHHGETDPLKGYLAGTSGGCSSTKDATGLPLAQTVPIAGARTWVAVKNRFFVTALASSSQANTGFSATATRDAGRQDYLLKSVSADVSFAGLQPERTSLFYVGPKKQDLLWDLGLRDVMEFGMWRWVCYPLVWILKVFHTWVPSYGVGIILLTILVRILFWPLTHKSTISMRKMQEIQPKVKEIREKFKDNPQRLQQETWQVYRENKVNPMASCLPMLVQIPVFIGLFTVLRSAVELRYAPFLWIADLSEPENLFPTIFPFGGLNILPILMAATMALQSALTPSTGDKQQQRMMMVMMPIMMLVMFYSFPAALSLYWTLSQVFSIAQMWWIRKKYGAPATLAASNAVVDAEVITRQMRRHTEK